MKITFKIWRQESPKDKGAIKNYEVDGLTEDMSFLEALDKIQNYKTASFQSNCNKMLQQFNRNVLAKNMLDLIRKTSQK